MPYLFNGKELDQETNLTYFDARYLDMKTSLWLNTDPLSGYNPIQETEHYIDGQHNNGVFNPMNNNTYGYTYNNPIVFVDPNGKQTISGWIEGKIKSFNREISYGTFSNYSVPVIVPGKLREGKSPFVNNCWHACERQIKNANTNLESGKASNRINMIESPRQSKNSQTKVNIVEGVEVILENLSKNRPIMAGVSYTDKQNINENVATDHFITIVGAGTDKNGVYLSYVDNAASTGKKGGTNTKENRLYFDAKSKQFIDKTPPLNKAQKYILSEVRPTNIKKND